MSNRTTTSKKSIFAVTRPSSLLNTIHSQTSNCLYIHCSQIQIPDCTSATGRQCCPTNLTCQKSQNRSPLEQRLISTTRQNRFFQKLFQTIHKRLLYTKKPPSIRPHTTLHCTHNSTLHKSLESNCKLQWHYSGQNHNQQILNHFSIVCILSTLLLSFFIYHFVYFHVLYRLSSFMYKKKRNCMCSIKREKQCILAKEKYTLFQLLIWNLEFLFFFFFILHKIL